MCIVISKSDKQNTKSTKSQVLSVEVSVFSCSTYCAAQSQFQASFHIDTFAVKLSKLLCSFHQLWIIDQF